MRGRSLFPSRVIFEHLVLFLFYILLFYRSKKKKNAAGEFLLIDVFSAKRTRRL